MKESKGIRISALLMAMLLIGMAFVPAVSANAEKVEIEKRLKDVGIDWITDKEDTKEYYATVLADDKEQKFFVTQVSHPKIKTDTLRPHAIIISADFWS